MSGEARIEDALEAAVARTEQAACPPTLAEAIRYAVFPGGARIRPRLCLAVAAACAEDQPALTDAAAVAIELLHCASLVHDDLPCFDDAPLRRGKPSVHRAYDERIAVLVGDALIVLAFEVVGDVLACAPARGQALLLTVARSVGAPAGIVAGQAWECEPRVGLAQYQRAKTGSLFAAATAAGALAAGADAARWRQLGEHIGEAYQVADDLHDVASDTQDLGKPTGRDAALGRPSAVGEMGVRGAIQRLDYLVNSAVESIPASPGSELLREMICVQARSFLPKKLAAPAAA